MRCPKCGKMYPSNKPVCEICKERLVTEEIYKNITAQQAESQNLPKCPICGSTDLKKLTSLDRGASAFMWGLGSNKIGKTYECRKCRTTF